MGMFEAVNGRLFYVQHSVLPVVMIGKYVGSVISAH